MGLGYDVVHPQELELKLAGKDADKHGFALVIDCTGNPKACQKVSEFVKTAVRIIGVCHTISLLIANW